MLLKTFLSETGQRFWLFGSIVSVCRTWLVNISQLNGARTSNNGAREICDTQRTSQRATWEIARATKTSPAHLPIQSDRKPTKESLGCLRHNGRYSPPLKEMLLFSADGRIQKVTHCSPLALFFSFVKPQFRTPREIATNHSWPPLFGCSLIWGRGLKEGSTVHSLAIYDRLSVRLLSVCPQESRLNSLTGLLWTQTIRNSSLVWWLFLLASIRWKELCTLLR